MVLEKLKNLRSISLIDLYACVECGRCTSMCPATGTGKMLSPMDLIVKLRDHLNNTGRRYLQTAMGTGFAFAHITGNQLALASSKSRVRRSRSGTCSITLV